MDDPRTHRGRTTLAAIEGSDRASIVSALRDVAPDLAGLAIDFVYGELYTRDALTLQQRQLATVAALAAMGNARAQLEFHIGGALNVGVAPEAIVELMIHLVVYAGFPAALNGTAAAKAVFEERGVRLPAGATPPRAAATRFDDGWACLRAIDGELGEAVVASLREVAPDLGRFIVEFAFGEIYTRVGLDLPARELVTVAALTALGSAAPQSKVHMHGFLNVGGSREQLVETVTHIAAYAGFPRAINGALLVAEVLAERRPSETTDRPRIPDPS